MKNKYIKYFLMTTLTFMLNSCESCDSINWILKDIPFSAPKKENLGYYLGSQNLGSTCYSNSLMVYLSKDSHFIQELNQVAIQKNNHFDANTTSPLDTSRIFLMNDLLIHLNSLRQRISLLEESKEKLLTRTHILDPFFRAFLNQFHHSIDNMIRSNPFLGNGFQNVFDQNDPNDFLSLLLDIMDINTTDSFILHPYVETLYYDSIDTHQRFLKQNNILNPRIELDLAYNGAHCHSIGQCIREYQRPFHIPNKALPNGHFEDVSAQRLFLIDNNHPIEAPSFISVYLKRQILQQDGTLTKSLAHVNIDEKIVIPFHHVNLNKVGTHYDIIADSSLALINKLNLNPADETDLFFVEYEVESIIVHMGNENGGHYINYSKIGNNYYLFDDTSVTSEGNEIQALPNIANNAHTILYKKRG